MNTPATRNIRQARVLLVLFMLGLLLSGLTAFPLEWELETLTAWLGIAPDASPDELSGLARWLATVRDGLRDTGRRYPWLAYGTDWLAFAHLILVVLFVGAVVDPVRNVWVITFGLIACAGVVPLALICGQVRGIPFYWRLIDCSFGLVAFVPLWWARRLVQRAA